MAKRRIKKPVVEPVEPFNMTLHVSVTVALFIVALLLLILWGSCYDRKNNITPVDRYSQLPVLQYESFDAWLDVHKNTCNQCRESMDENPNVGICAVAFEKMKEFLRRDRTQTKAIPSLPVVSNVLPTPQVPGACVAGKEGCVPCPRQPPQPTTIPPPLDVSLSSYQGDDEPEDNTTERPGCEGGACETGGWYLGKRLGRR